LPKSEPRPSEREKINLIVGAALRGRPDPRAFIGKRATTQGRPYR
jgi:hypothetical protein